MADLTLAPIRYSECLAEAGVERCVGSKGDSYDNALAETINGLYKTEPIRRRAPEDARGRRTGDPGLGTLVQSSSLTRTTWLYTAGRS